MGWLLSAHFYYLNISNLTMQKTFIYILTIVFSFSVLSFSLLCECVCVNVNSIYPTCYDLFYLYAIELHNFICLTTSIVYYVRLYPHDVFIYNFLCHL